jgi:hypothetical protein
MMPSENNDSQKTVIYHPEIDLRMKCKCGDIAIPAYDGEIWFYKCQKCGKILVHAHSCQDCDLAGKPHEAEFNDLRDDDGGSFLNAIGLVDGKIDRHAFSWVALHGCKTYRRRK